MGRRTWQQLRSGAARSAVLGELAAIGLTAGVLGAAAALPLSSALGLHASPGRAALAVPIAVGVAFAQALRRMPAAHLLAEE